MLNEKRYLCRISRGAWTRTHLMRNAISSSPMLEFSWSSFPPVFGIHRCMHVCDAYEVFSWCRVKSQVPKFAKLKMTRQRSSALRVIIAWRIMRKFQSARTVLTWKRRLFFKSKLLHKLYFTSLVVSFKMIEFINCTHVHVYNIIHNSWYDMIRI